MQKLLNCSIKTTERYRFLKGISQIYYINGNQNPKINKTADRGDSNFISLHSYGRPVYLWEKTKALSYYFSWAHSTSYLLQRGEIFCSFSSRLKNKIKLKIYNSRCACLNFFIFEKYDCQLPISRPKLAKLVFLLFFGF